MRFGLVHFITYFLTQLVYVLAAYGRGLLKNPIASPSHHLPLASVDTETKVKHEWRNVPMAHNSSLIIPSVSPVPVYQLLNKHAENVSE
jgi:hypothetical protein